MENKVWILYIFCWWQIIYKIMVMNAGWREIYMWATMFRVLMFSVIWICYSVSIHKHEFLSILSSYQVFSMFIFYPRSRFRITAKSPNLSGERGSLWTSSWTVITCWRWSSGPRKDAGTRSVWGRESTFRTCVFVCVCVYLPFKASVWTSLKQIIRLAAKHLNPEKKKLSFSGDFEKSSLDFFFLTIWKRTPMSAQWEVCVYSQVKKRFL